ncbi:GntR family transcriptional regulator [Castellaniella sp.]|uniref:GntR family transcriptional regulator n=1 Tax=Castellaniella sp. TaxID=1955812 RepID=UPI003C73A10C
MMDTPDTTLPQLSPTGTPLYAQVKHAVLNTLASGEWKQGEAIPSEKVLSDRFRVSIGTLRKAIGELVAENILVRHQGRGTFVAIHTRNQHFFKFFRVVAHDGTKAYPTTQLHRFRHLRANKEAREKLQLGAGSYVFEFLNILSLEGHKTIIDVITVPETLFRGLTAEQLHTRQSTLYSFYQNVYGINVIAATEHLRIVTASQEFADLLGLSLPHPLLQIRRVAYSYNGQPIEWRLSHVNTDAHDYVGLDHESHT